MLLTCCCIFSVAACDANGNSESKQYSESTQNGDNAQESTYSSVMCSHVYTSTITIEPTCRYIGIKTYTCRFCNDSYTEEIAKLTTHSYRSEYTVKPTATSTGVITYTCRVCGDSYTETAPMVPAIEYGDFVTVYRGRDWAMASFYEEGTQFWYDDNCEEVVRVRFSILVSAYGHNSYNSRFRFSIKLYNSYDRVLDSGFWYTPLLGPDESTTVEADFYLSDSPLEPGKTYKAILAGIEYA